MNFGKLLGVGMSIFGHGPAVSYRRNKHVSLPKFNEGKDPLAPKKAIDAVPTPPSEEEAPPMFVLNGVGKATAPAAASASAHVAVAPASGKESAQVPESTPTPGERLAAYASKLGVKRVVPLDDKPAASSGAKSAKQGAKQAWTTRLNPFRPPEPAPRPVGEQMKLSLDAVKVVTNDLADADVDVVPVKSHNAAPEAAVLPPSRRTLEYLGDNILKSS